MEIKRFELQCLKGYVPKAVEVAGVSVFSFNQKRPGWRREWGKSRLGFALRMETKCLGRECEALQCTRLGAYDNGIEE